MIQELITRLIPHICVELYLGKADTNLYGQCYQLLTTKLIGYTIMSLSLFAKIPQILKIYEGKSGKGINMSTQSVMILSLASEFSYAFISGYGFSTFGDTLCNFVQTMTIVYLCLFYNSRPVSAILSFISAFSGALFLCSGLVPLHVLKYLNRLGFLLKFVGASYQNYTNYVNKSTGQISFWSTFIGFSIVTSKVIISVFETGDIQLAIGASMRVFTISILLGQIVYYRSPGKNIEDKKRL